MKVCMLVYAFYESDSRVLQYAESLAKRGNQVDILALRKENQKKFGVLNGVRIFRIQKRVLNENRQINYLLKLLSFFVKSLVLISKKHLKTPYDIIHVHSVPDFLVFAAWLAKFSGAKVILDIHDILPEFYASKFGKDENSFFYRLLILVERISTAFSDHVIIANDLWRARLLDRSTHDAKCTTILNFPNVDIFYRRPRKKENHKCIIIYPGSLNWHQGVDVAIHSFALIKREVPTAEFHIYGDGSRKNKLTKMIKDLDLEDSVLIRKPVALSHIAEIMSQADIGIVPKRSDTFGNEAFSTKILEFMALGIPVAVSDTAIDKYYFDDSLVAFFKSGDASSLAQCLLALIRDDTLRARLINNATRFIQKHTWQAKEHIYLEILDSVADTAT